MATETYDPRVEGELTISAIQRLRLERHALEVQIRLLKIRNMTIDQDLDQCDRILHLEWDALRAAMKQRP